MFGVRLIASDWAMGPPGRGVVSVPETSTTVQASGRASAMAGCSHELSRAAGCGKTGAGIGAAPAAVGAAGCCARLVGVSCNAIQAARCGLYRAARPATGPARRLGRRRVACLPEHGPVGLPVGDFLRGQLGLMRVDGDLIGKDAHP